MLMLLPIKKSDEVAFSISNSIIILFTLTH